MDIAATIGTEPQIYAVFKAGAEKLGWSVEMQDANNDPSKALQATQLLIQEKVDAIVFSSMPAQFVLGSVQAAKRANIPTINIVTHAQDGVYDAQYTFTSTPETMAPLIDEMKKALPAGAEVATIGSSIILGNSNLPATLKSSITSAGFKIAQDVDVPLGAFSQAYQQSAGSIVRAHPNVKAIIDEIGYVHDLNVGLGNANASSDVKLFSFSDTNTSIPELVSPDSRLKALLVPEYPNLALLALDNLLNHFGTPKADLPESQTVSDSFVTTLANLPAALKNAPDSNAYPIPTADVLAPYLERWAKDYTLTS